MTERADHQPHELQELLRLAQAELALLTEQSEQLLLLGSVSECLSRDAPPAELVYQVLERISLLRHTDLCLLGEPTGDEFIVRVGYCDREAESPVSLRLPADALRVVEQGEPWCSDYPNGVELEYLPARGSTSANADTRDWLTLSATQLVLIPARSRWLKSGHLVLIVSSCSARSLTPELPTLARLERLLSLRCDHLVLVDELRAINEQLDGLVESRTHQLTHTNQQLERSERHFRSLVEGAGDAIFVVAADQRIVDANQQACVSLGYSREELLELVVADIETGLTRDQIAVLNQRVSEQQVQNAATSLMGTHRRKDGSTFPVEVRLSPVMGGPNELPSILALARDISERRQLEAQLLQSQKTDAVGQLAAGISHDFNNLLTAILGYCELLLMTLPETEPGREDVEQIQLAGARAAALTQQLLGFTGRQAVAIQQVSLGQLSQDARKLLGRLLGETVTLDFELPDEPLCTRADPIQLHQVLLNLALNARDAMPNGGQLTLRLGQTLLDEAEATRLGSLAAGPYAEWTLTDTGIGMSAEVQTHLFEPFFTTKAPGAGTGLGLSTVYAIVARFGGAIMVESAPEQGSTFRIWLPLATEPCKAAAAPEVARVTLRGGSERILVVDDNEAVLRFLCESLRRLGYQVDSATDGIDALTKLSTAGALPSLVLSDVVMPRLDGYGLAREIAEHYPSLPLILMSGCTPSAESAEGAQSRNTPFLRKPIALAPLSETLRAVLDAR